ncbi:hypothetical protein GCM10007887_01530 [Methylobacterium haplocladii]|uniref:Uncharacterized protein n=1 Tax=Methylobacterium haplocladii TaxID=1176176 RepID=A0A512IJI4_9HYPH|nr:hypothetical protein MHA02_02580 [Methylobacterium haplocladii]GLS57498.1 hypothetical protein GCM10007887_01530 [Methylobacterium haplocladii]
MFGASGRTDAAHASLMLVDAILVEGGAARFVRVTLPGDAELPKPQYRPDDLVVVQATAADVGEIRAIVVEEIAAARRSEADLVLDLPAACLVEPDVLDGIEVPVIVVGPTPFDEHAAAFLLHALAEIPVPVGGKLPWPWLLGCGRGNACAASAFERDMGRISCGMDMARTPRVFPVTWPTLSKAEALRILVGDRSARTLALGLPLLASLRAAREKPDAPAIDAGSLASAPGADANTGKTSHRRDVGDRLRDLADALQAIEDYDAPTQIELDCAPRIEDWKSARREVRVVTGRVYGHPDIADGRPIVTSDLYASDGTSWARTLSRYYRLGEPARGQDRRDFR